MIGSRQMLSRERIFGAVEREITRKEIARLEDLARKHGAEFHAIPVAGGCACGRGCKRGECPIRNTWFTADHEVVARIAPILLEVIGYIKTT